jgi:hypothetical protein
MSVAAQGVALTAVPITDQVVCAPSGENERKVWAEVVHRWVTPMYIGTQGDLRRRSTGSSLLAPG